MLASESWRHPRQPCTLLVPWAGLRPPRAFVLALSIMPPRKKTKAGGVENVPESDSTRRVTRHRRGCLQNLPDFAVEIQLEVCLYFAHIYTSFIPECTYHAHRSSAISFPSICFIYRGPARSSERSSSTVPTNDFGNLRARKSRVFQLARLS